jgi:tryptophan 2,3-dioxygenase
MNIDNNLMQILDMLEEKYGKSGQDIKAYLEGLLHADYLNYWDYIHIDTLLTLQKPKTPIPDELIFIVYHQITELYFKLCLHEIKQISELKGYIHAEFFTARLKRVNAYFKNLIHSFEIMVDGMDKDQFLQFRMSLLPASGFQSAQYRMIEICATDMINLVDKSYIDKVAHHSSIREQFEYIYWKAGATEADSGKRTLTLSQFIDKYEDQFVALAEEFTDKNVLNIYMSMKESDRNNVELINEMRTFDENVNVYWPLVHYKSAVRYLQRSPKDIAATGGTNWQKYLPPRFQKRIFFPQLWSEHEIEEWGKKGLFN